jgi:hypothetical protein
MSAGLTISAPSAAAIEAGHDLVFAHLEDLALRAARYWEAVALAASLGEADTAAVYCRKLAAVTKEAFQTVRDLQESAAS